MLLYKLRRLLASLFVQANISVIIFATVSYAAISYGLLVWAGEQDLLEPNTFFYWMVVTASTVGYGDLSPTTPEGRFIVSLWVIPVGLSLFALILTKGGIVFTDFISRGKRGLRMIRHENHIVIVGWNGTRTLRLIDQITSKTNVDDRKVVLVVQADIENPLPDEIGFVKVEAFTHTETMERANLAYASSVIIDTPNDDVTLTTALLVDKLSPNSFKTAYFQDEAIGELLKSHCPNIECIPSIAVELLAKATMDPGSGRLHRQLLDNTYGMTQYSIQYEGDQEIEYRQLFNHFKASLDATLIGIRRKGAVKIDINPELSDKVQKDDRLFYIASTRLNSDACFAITPLLEASSSV